jgi:hypothetical protein
LLGDTGRQRHEVVAFGECGAVKMIQLLELMGPSVDPECGIVGLLMKKVCRGGS